MSVVSPEMSINLDVSGYFYLKIKQIMKIKEKYKVFGGIVSNNIKDFKNREEMVHHQKMLKAYLKGHTLFQNGYERDEYGHLLYPLQPKYFPVLRVLPE